MTVRSLAMVVEDDPDLRSLVHEILDDEGFEVISAANGAEALSRLMSGVRPSVILLDLTMPVMDGFQFRAEQRAHPELAQIPTIVLSASEDVHRKTDPLGVAFVLKKPFELDDLISAAKTWCRRS